MAEYFYIVESEASRAVVDIADPLQLFASFLSMARKGHKTIKGSPIKVSEWNGSDKQLWKWTADGSLENKECHFVISISQDGTAVVEEKDGTLPHKWRLEGGMLRSQEKEDTTLIQDKYSLLQAYTVTNEGNAMPKWRLIPQATWNAYTEYLCNPNPLIMALILKANLLEHLESILGCTITEYEITLAECVSTVNDCAARLDEVLKDEGKAKSTGESVVMAGKTLSLLGLYLSPFTAGASLALTVAGGVTAGAGGLTSLGATITESCYNSSEQSKIKPVIEKAIRFSTALQSMVLDVCREMQNGYEFSKTPAGMSFRQELSNERKLGKSIYKTCDKAVKTGRAVKKGIDNFKAFKEIKSVAAFIEADAQAIKGATVGLAENAAADGLKVPFTGKVLLQSGSTGAKVFSSTLSFLGIAFGISDAVKGASQRGKSSDIAKKMTKLAKYINKEGQALIQTYNELSSYN